jgi:hypothetical protein
VDYHASKKWEKEHKSVDTPSVHFHLLTMTITGNSVIGVNSGTFNPRSMSNKRDRKEDLAKVPRAFF